MRVLFRDLNSMVSRAAAASRRLGTTIRGPVLWLTVCGALLVTAIFAGTIMMVAEFRERALANSERELQNTVLLLTRHFDQQFEDSDTIAADVIVRLRIPGIASPQAFRELISSSESHEILRSKAGVLSYLGDISIMTLTATSSIGRDRYRRRPLTSPNAPTSSPLNSIRNHLRSRPRGFAALSAAV
jgi:hypothetical protein